MKFRTIGIGLVLLAAAGWAEAQSTFPTATTTISRVETAADTGEAQQAGTGQGIEVTDPRAMPNFQPAPTADGHGTGRGTGAGTVDPVGGNLYRLIEGFADQLREIGKRIERDRVNLEAGIRDLKRIQKDVEKGLEELKSVVEEHEEAQTAEEPEPQWGRRQPKRGNTAEG